MTPMQTVFPLEPSTSVAADKVSLVMASTVKVSLVGVDSEPLFGFQYHNPFNLDSSD